MSLARFRTAKLMNRFGMADTVAVRADQHIVDALQQTGRDLPTTSEVVDTVNRLAAHTMPVDLPEAPLRVFSI